MVMGTQGWSKGKLLRYAAVTMVLLLLLAEGIGRVVFFFRFRGLGTSVYVQGSPIQEADTVTVYNNRAFYVDFGKGFQYNELGMKSSCGDYRMPVKSSGDLWVLLLGGSAMEGMGSNKDGAWFDMTNISDHPYGETIASFLEVGLQRKFPGKRVRVFNAAVSGFTLEQGMARYKSLSKRYDFDWVISMDGVNECDTLVASVGSGAAAASDSGAERAFSRAYWASMPFHRFPLNWIVPITEHSALFGLLKQEFYGVRMRARVRRNEGGGFALRKSWAARVALPLLVDSGDERVGHSVGAFLQEEREFAGVLEKDSRHYLLLVQPYLAFRDTSVLGPEEKALDHYLRQEMNDRYKHAFLKGVEDSVGEDLRIQTMSGVEKWPGWVFVDYCHFTREANERIAGELFDFIVADGKMGIFK
jgi:hypothetical protein